MTNTIQYKNLTILDGINTHPGSGNLHNHTNEIKIFEDIIDKIDIKKEPMVMIEIGCFWALWSLIFKNKNKNTKNIIIDLSKRALSVGEINFKMNNFDYISYHGGFFINDSGTYHNKEYDILYIPNPTDYFDETVVGELVGKELNFFDIINENSIKIIDLLHMDIQGSELPLILDIKKNGTLNIIKHMIVATHSSKIHSQILDILNKSHNVKINISSNTESLGGDGYIYATVKE